jgi:hypothetical protein
VGVFKKRPRAARHAVIFSARPDTRSKTEPHYWRGRLFRNTFTYKGQRIEVNGWSAKIQLYGRRKTFSLSSSDPTRAAEEACRIYQTILAQGWEAVADHRTLGGSRDISGQESAQHSSAAELEDGMVGSPS